MVCQGRFCDDDGSVHEDNIELMAVWGITIGCDANDSTKYCPSAQITRRQMATFIYRAVNPRWPIQIPTGITINDVPADASYRPYANWLVSIGAFQLDDGNFNPRGIVTRADMAVMMVAAFPHIQAVSESQNLFADTANLDAAVVRAIEGIAESEVTRGCTTTPPLRYCPNNPVTRAQMASFFVRVINQAPTTTDES